MAGNKKSNQLLPNGKREKKGGGRHTSISFLKIAGRPRRLGENQTSLPKRQEKRKFKGGTNELKTELHFPGKCSRIVQRGGKIHREICTRSRDKRAKKKGGEEQRGRRVASGEIIPSGSPFLFYLLGSRRGAGEGRTIHWGAQKLPHELPSQIGEMAKKCQCNKIGGVKDTKRRGKRRKKRGGQRGRGSSPQSKVPDVPRSGWDRER